MDARIYDNSWLIIQLFLNSAHLAVYIPEFPHRTKFYQFCNLLLTMLLTDMLSTMSELHEKMEKLRTRKVENLECIRAKRIKDPNRDLLASNYRKGKFNQQQFVVQCLESQYDCIMIRSLRFLILLFSRSRKCNS